MKKTKTTTRKSKTNKPKKTTQSLSASSKGLAAKAKASGISVSTLRKVYNRGMAAWKSGHRPGVTQQQWAMGRVNSFITGKGGARKADKDLTSKKKSKKK